MDGNRWRTLDYGPIRTRKDETRRTRNRATGKDSGASNALTAGMRTTRSDGRTNHRNDRIQFTRKTVTLTSTAFSTQYGAAYSGGRNNQSTQNRTQTRKDSSSSASGGYGFSSAWTRRTDAPSTTSMDATATAAKDTRYRGTAGRMAAATFLSYVSRRGRTGRSTTGSTRRGGTKRR